MDTLEITVANDQIWQQLKEALGEGFELFTFTLVTNETVTIRAVKGLTTPIE